jgi:hypothetical protein
MSLRLASNYKIAGAPYLWQAKETRQELVRVEVNIRSFFARARPLNAGSEQGTSHF